MKPAPEGEAAVLLVEGERVKLQSACRNHLDGHVVLHRPRGVDVDVRDGWRLPCIHTGKGQEAGNETI